MLSSVRPPSYIAGVSAATTGLNQLSTGEYLHIHTTHHPATIIIVTVPFRSGLARMAVVLSDLRNHLEGQLAAKKTALNETEESLR